MDFIKCFRTWLGMVAVLFASGLLTGCALFTGSSSNPSSSPDSAYKFDPLSQGGGGSGVAGQPTPGPALMPPAAGESDSRQEQSGRILRVGEGVTVTFQDLPSAVAPIDTTIKEDGTITLIYNKQFHAADKTVGQLENEIRQAYVPAYFVNMTPTIATKDRWFYVDGEVRAPGRQVYLHKMTVLDAIATVGGFTDFARKSKVQLTRADGKTFFVNSVKAQKKPELNLEVFPDDRVTVWKRWW